MFAKKISLVSAALVLAGSAAVSFAQCDDSAPILESNTALNLDTCGGVVGLDLGGAILGHPTLVYRFDYQDDGGAGVEPDQIQITGSEREFAIGTSCSTAPIGGGAPGLPFNVETLTPGTRYYVFFTSDSGLPVTAPPRCGAVAVNTDTLPVELQSFSVE